MRYIILIPFLLAGCAGQQLAQIRQGTEAATAKCSDKQTALAQEQCFALTVRPTMQASGYPYMDLFELDMAKRQDIAAKVDNGKLTQQEAQLQIAEYQSMLTSEQQRRASLAMHAQQPNNAAMMNAGLQLMQMSQPRSLAPAAGPGITCHRQGAFTRCY